MCSQVVIWISANLHLLRDHHNHSWTHLANPTPRITGLWSTLDHLKRPKPLWGMVGSCGYTLRSVHHFLHIGLQRSTIFWKLTSYFDWAMAAIAMQCYALANCNSHHLQSSPVRFSSPSHRGLIFTAQARSSHFPRLRVWRASWSPWSPWSRASCHRRTMDAGDVINWLGLCAHMESLVMMKT